MKPESNPRRLAESQKAFTVKELSTGIRLLVGVGVTLWVSPVAWAGPGGNIPGPGVCDYPGVGGSNFEAGIDFFVNDQILLGKLLTNLVYKTAQLNHEILPPFSLRCCFFLSLFF